MIVVVKDSSMLEVVPDKADYHQETVLSTYQISRYTNLTRPRLSPGASRTQKTRLEPDKGFSHISPKERAMTSLAMKGLFR